MTDSSKSRPIYMFEVNGLSTSAEAFGDLESFCTHVPFEVHQSDEVVAVGHAHLLRLELAKTYGIGAADVIKACKEGLAPLYAALFDPGTDLIRPEFAAPSVRRDIFYIDGIKLSAAHRGRELGLMFVERLRDMFGQGCAVMVLRAAPMARYKESRSNGLDNDPLFFDEIDDEVYAVPFEAKGEAAKEKLRTHFEKIGLKRVGDTDFMVFDMTAVRSAPH